VEFRSALADCCTSLGELLRERDSQRSAREFQESLAIRESLRREGLKQLQSNMAYVDALLDTTEIDGLPESERKDFGTEKQIERLESMHRTRDHVLELLSSDPAAIYELCCELNIPGPRLHDVAPEDRVESE
jgi:hypothetical protein